MPLLEYGQMAWETLIGNKLRSSLALIGVAIAVAAVVGLSAVSTGSRRAIITQLTSFGARLFVVDSGEPKRASIGVYQPITPGDVTTLTETIGNITRVAPETWFKTPWRTVERGGTMLVHGVVPDGLEMEGLHVTAGRWFVPEDEYQYVLVIGRESAETIYGSADIIGEAIVLDGRKFTVIGVVERAGGFVGSIAPSTKVFVPLTTAQRITGQQGYLQITVESVDPPSIPDIRDATSRLLSARHPGFSFATYVFEHSADDVKMVFGILTKVITAVTAISLIVGGIGVTNIMLVSVTERTREIGLRKAIGATRGHIRTQFVVEAVLICLAGGTLGLLVAAAMVFVMENFWFHLGLRLPLYAVGLALAVSIGTGLITGVYPAVRAAALEPVDALRYE